MLAASSSFAIHGSGSGSGNDADNDVDNADADEIVLGPMATEPRSASGNGLAGVTGPGQQSVVLDIALQRKLMHAERKLDLATYRLNTLHMDRGENSDTTKAAASLNASIRELSRLLAVLDPAYLLEQVSDRNTKQCYDRYKADWTAYEKAAKEGGSKHGWNLLAGGLGNLICFGIGGALSVLSGSPATGLVINTVAWTFAEPLISMLRATNVSNPYLDYYMVRQHLQARAVREYLQGTAGLERNRKFAWKNRDTGKTEWLHAAEWLNRTSWRSLWAGKWLSDDVIYHVYSLAFSLTNCLPEFFGKSLYDMSTRQGMLTYLGIRTGGGMIAGAVIQEYIQLMHARQMNKTGGQESVTKPLAFWKREADYVGMLLANLDKRLGNDTIDALERRALYTLKNSLELWHGKAIAKSRLHTSVLYEWKVMLQAKREAMGIDPEVPGRRLDTLASFIGKGLSQMTGTILAATANASVSNSTIPWLRWMAYVVPPVASIELGFAHRREFDVIVRTLLAVPEFLFRRCCGSGEDEENQT